MERECDLIQDDISQVMMALKKDEDKVRSHYTKMDEMNQKINEVNAKRGMDSIQKHIDVKITEKDNISIMITDAKKKLDILKGFKE